MVRAREANPRLTVAGREDTRPVELTLHDSILAGDPNTPNNPDWNQLRSMPTPVITDAPEGVFASIKLVSTVVGEVSAPNVVAMVRGSDPQLRDEYIVFSGHMDHIGTVGDGVGGCNPFTRPDSTVDTICNGADDDGSGTIAVMSIAEAVTRLKGQTRRSIVVLNVSGEEKGLYGSKYFAEHPTVPMGKVVADINLDMIGRNSPDSIVVIGKEHSDMGQTLARVQAAHPELKLIASDDIWPTQNFYSRSDHFNFARKGVPVLFFFNGTHPQYHQADDEVKLIDAQQARPRGPAGLLSRRRDRQHHRQAAMESGELPDHRGRAEGTAGGGEEAVSESTSITDFDAFRARMNDVILGAGNLTINRFFALDARAYEAGALGSKTKEMLGLVASLVLRCDDCITYHVLRCHEEGVTREEFLEVFSVGLVVGGSIVIPHLRRAMGRLEELTPPAPVSCRSATPRR